MFTSLLSKIVKVTVMSSKFVKLALKDFINGFTYTGIEMMFEKGSMYLDFADLALNGIQSGFRFSGLNMTNALISITRPSFLIEYEKKTFLYYVVAGTTSVFISELLSNPIRTIQAKRKKQGSMYFYADTVRSSINGLSSSIFFPLVADKLSARFPLKNPTLGKYIVHNSAILSTSSFIASICGIPINRYFNNIRVPLTYYIKNFIFGFPETLMVNALYTCAIKGK